MKQKKSEIIIPILLIFITASFILIMLVLPLISVMANALKKGFPFYLQSLSSEYVISALKNTFHAVFIPLLINTFFGLTASFTLTKYHFRGKQLLASLIDIPFSVSPVIAGLSYIMMFGSSGLASPLIEWINETFHMDIQIVFARPGVILATIFVTFPFVAREIIPILNSRGNEEEEAAALMGAGFFTIFRKVTFPHIKWSMIYGMILCTARALGEFGAVSALSKTRGKNFTLPLEIDALYMSGTADSIIASFAVSSVLVIFAIVILILRNICESSFRTV